MEFKAIETDEELTQALKRIDQIIDAEPGTCEYDELRVWSILVQFYEQEHIKILPPDPLEAIKIRMMDLEIEDPASLFGSKSIASEVFSGKRLLSKVLVEKLHVKLGIPYRTLMKVAIKKPSFVTTN